MRPLQLLADASGYVGPPAVVADAALVELALAEDVAPLLGARCAAGELRAADDGSRLALLRAYHGCLAANLLAEQAATPLLAALRSRGVPVLLLKGAALLRTVYRHPGCRRMADIDILVPSRHWRTALEIASSLGEEVRSRERRLTLSLYHERHVFMARRFMVDLHRAITPWPLFRVDHDAMFARARADSAGCLLQAPEDLFVHLAIHAAVDGFAVPFRSVIDGLALLASGRVDPSAVVTRASDWRARRATATWLWVLLRYGLAREWESTARSLYHRRAARLDASRAPRSRFSVEAPGRWAVRWTLARSLDGIARPLAFFSYRGLLLVGDCVLRPLTPRASARRGAPRTTE